MREMELKKSAMAFELKDGSILWISKEDCSEIAHHIIIEGALLGNTVIIKESDKSIQKANMLYDILKSEKNMNPEIRDGYLRQIGEILNGREMAYINKEGNEVEYIPETNTTPQSK